MQAALMSATALTLPVRVAVSFAMPSRRDLNARTMPRFALKVASSLPAAVMSAVPENFTSIVGGVHSAFA